VAQEGGDHLPSGIFKKFCCSPPPQARAGTLSAQVSTFVKIASSEYEVRFTRLRLIDGLERALD
jgi:hypothetical protein